MLKRNKKVTFRLTEQEHSRLQSRVRKSRLSKEAYLRQLINGLVPKDAPPTDYFQMMRELSSIGNNLNQLAHVANTTGDINQEEYRAAVSSLDEAIKRITREVASPEKISLSFEQSPPDQELTSGTERSVSSEKNSTWGTVDGYY